MFACFYGLWHPATVRKVAGDQVQVLWESEYSASWLPASDVVPVAASARPPTAAASMQEIRNPAPAVDLAGERPKNIRAPTDGAATVADEQPAATMPAGSVTTPEHWSDRPSADPAFDEDGTPPPPPPKPRRHWVPKYADAAAGRGILLDSPPHGPPPPAPAPLAPARSPPMHGDVAAGQEPSRPKVVHDLGKIASASSDSDPSAFSGTYTLQSFLKRHHLGVESQRLMDRLPEEVCLAAIAGFVPPANPHKDADDQLKRYVNGILRKMGYVNGMLKKSPSGPSRDSFTIETFVDHWRLDRSAAPFLLSYPAPVIDEVLKGFAPTGGTRNVDALFRSYVRSIASAFSSAPGTQGSAEAKTNPPVLRTGVTSAPVGAALVSSTERSSPTVNARRKCGKEVPKKQQEKRFGFELLRDDISDASDGSDDHAKATEEADAAAGEVVF